MTLKSGTSNQKHDISLVEVSEETREFTYQVYAATRADEVAMFGWQDAQADAFLRSQFDIRRRSYSMQFPAAIHSVILYDGCNAGSIIVDRSDTTVTLVDIAVSPEYRKRGIASHVLRELQTQARDENLSVALHVERVNANAFSLYCKHGFGVSAENDLYYEMTWTPR